MLEASAPGKLVIAGEYAVLEGATAIAIAVDVRARARVGRASGASRLDVAEAGSWEFHCGDGRELRWDRPPGAHARVPEAVLAALARADRLPRRLPALRIELDTCEFHRVGPLGQRAKLGLGSSAAITVALAAALSRACDARLPTPALLDLCLDAHRALQGGAGSGIDVAAAVHGGVVGLDAGLSPACFSRLDWPAGLHWLAVWSGQPASTPEMLQRFAAFRAAQPREFARQLARLSGLARVALDAWRERRVPAILAALEAYAEGLRSLDAASGLGIWTETHERIAVYAREAGVVYKTAGAGGGDFGLAFAPDLGNLRELQARLAGLGLWTITNMRTAAGVAYGKKRWNGTPGS